MLSILGIIPARFGSTRFPGKPLVMIHGKSMIQRVYEQSRKSNYLQKVIVATDDQRIADHVISFGGEVILTSASHQSGTDRCAEVIQQTNEQFDAVINIQGDEPFIDPEQIDAIALALINETYPLATLVKVIESEEEIHNPNVVKAVLDNKGKAIYFSRLPIPYNRDKQNSTTYYKHIGIYGYTRKALLEITKLPQGKLELAESLEQLRWIEAGYSIITRVTQVPSVSIDTPEDLALVEKMMKS